jgi:hypothetical protein
LFFTPKSTTMAATGVMQHEHLTNGSMSIQWLLVKPWMCSIRQCASHIAPTYSHDHQNGQIPDFFVSLILLSPTNAANDHVMVIIKYNQVITFFIVLRTYVFIMGTHQQQWMPIWSPL